MKKESNQFTSKCIVKPTSPLPSLQPLSKEIDSCISINICRNYKKSDKKELYGCEKYIENSTNFCSNYDCTTKFKIITEKVIPASEIIPEIKNIKRECKICEWYIERNDNTLAYKHGTCHRYPPPTLTYQFPITKENGFCGEFKRKEDL